MTRYMSTYASHNKHGYRGVEWDAQKRRYRASIADPDTKKKRHLGYYDSAVDAARAYDGAARALRRPDEVFLNFPDTLAGERATVQHWRSDDGCCVHGHDLSVHGTPRADGSGRVQCRVCNNGAQKRYRQRIRERERERDSG